MEFTTLGNYIDRINLTVLHCINVTLENRDLTTRAKIKDLSLLHVHWENEPEAPYGIHLLIGFIALIVGTGGLIGNLMVISLFIR